MVTVAMTTHSSAGTNLADVRGVGRVFHPFDPVDRAAATFYRFSLGNMPTCLIFVVFVEV
jgi:hypothetical protein